MHPFFPLNLLHLLIISASAIIALPRDDLISSKKSPNKTSSSPVEYTAPAFCTSSSAWSGDAGLDSNLIHDCKAASITFWRAEVIRHGVAEFEFLNDDTVPAYHNVKQRTPRRYTYRTCTMAIINRPDLPNSYWPGVPLSRLPATDTVSYDDIYFSLLGVISECLHDLSHLGGEIAGQRGGVIIMLFRSQSPVDLAIPPSVGPIDLANATTESV